MKKWFTKKIPAKGAEKSSEWLCGFINRHGIAPGEILILNNVENFVVPHRPFDNTFHILYFAKVELQ